MQTDDLGLDIGIRKTERRHVACLHHVGPFIGSTMLFEGLFAQLLSWAVSRGLFVPGVERIAAFHTDPHSTPSQEQRISVCLPVPEGTLAEDGVEILEIPAGHYAVASGKLRFEQHAAAWWELRGSWIPQSGWRFREGFPFEVVRNVPSGLRDLHSIELWVPVRKH